MISVAVAGAGLAGVSAARTLAGEGFNVTVFDRGNRVGGRCSSSNRGVQCDHGAQFVTARDPAFAQVLSRLQKQGALAPWRGRFCAFNAQGDEVREPEARYVGVPTMSRLIEALAAPLDIVIDTRIARAEHGAAGWALLDDNGSFLGEYDALVLAMPPEQARALVPPDSPLSDVLRGVQSEPCWAALLTFSEPLPLTFDAGLFDHPTLTWAARDSSKPGRDNTECWVVHAGAAWSRARLRTAADEVAAELAATFLESHGLRNLRPAGIKAHRWSFARVTNGPRAGAFLDDDVNLFLCGDWCTTPDLEGAWLSGRRVATLLADNFGTRPTRHRAAGAATTA